MTEDETRNINDVVYRRVDQVVLRNAGDVVKTPGMSYDGRDIHPGIMFRCPCGFRVVWVTCPPHESIEYGDGERVTVHGSLGACPTGKYPRKNWCHGDLNDGKFSLYGDSVCPGMKMGVEKR